MKNDVIKSSVSEVILMCGPAGSGKSFFAKQFENKGMIVLSYDEESFKRGYKVHPLPVEVKNEIKAFLDEKLILLIEQNVDIVLDYSFWSREMREEYISLIKQYNIKPKIYYIKTPKEIIMARIRQRNGENANDIMLTEKTASFYYDHFQPPTSDEGDVVIVNGC